MSYTAHGQARCARTDRTRVDRSTRKPTRARHGAASTCSTGRSPTKPVRGSPNPSHSPSPNPNPSPNQDRRNLVYSDSAAAPRKGGPKVERVLPCTRMPTAAILGLMRVLSDASTAGLQ